VCVYCAIGQRASAVAKAVAVLRENGAMDYTVVVVTEGDDPPGLAYIAPYAATSIAERFMEAGRDVLIVYDDLTQHAQAYRELSCCCAGAGTRGVSRRYLLRPLASARTRDELRAELGGGSLTALPIVETEAQNISAYIPTNLISITDAKSIFRRRCSNWACCRRSMSANPFRALAARRSGRPIARGGRPKARLRAVRGA